MIKTGNPTVSIYTEMTPNPETMKFVANKLLYANKSIEISPQNAQLSPLAEQLYSFPFIKSVFIASNFVTIGKTPETDWLDIQASVSEFIKKYLEEDLPIINEAAIQSPIVDENDKTSGSDADIIRRIEELLETYVKPAVEMDGGAIQFKKYEKGVVTVIMQGSCSGCPSSTVTLKAGIEGMMKRMIPEVKEVVAEM